MATYDDLKAEHQTLSTTTVDTVKLTQHWPYIEVINKDASTALYCSQTDTTPASADPGTVYIAPSSSVIMPAVIQAGATPGSTSSPCHTVYLVGNGNAYGVVGVNSNG